MVWGSDIFTPLGGGKDPQSRADNPQLFFCLFMFLMSIWALRMFTPTKHMYIPPQFQIPRYNPGARAVALARKAHL